MRTRPARIEPGCPYCDEDHDPAIECRWMPESARFQLPPGRKPATRASQVIRDASGKIVAVKVVLH